MNVIKKVELLNRVDKPKAQTPAHKRVIKEALKDDKKEVYNAMSEQVILSGTSKKSSFCFIPVDIDVEED